MMEMERSGWVQENIKKAELTDCDNPRSGDGTRFLKGPEKKNLGFANHTSSVTATQPCCLGEKVDIDNIQGQRCACVTVKFSLQQAGQ